MSLKGHLIHYHERSSVFSNQICVSMEYHQHYFKSSFFHLTTLIKLSKNVTKCIKTYRNWIYLSGAAILPNTLFTLNWCFILFNIRKCFFVKTGLDEELKQLQNIQQWNCIKNCLSFVSLCKASQFQISVHKHT